MTLTARARDADATSTRAPLRGTQSFVAVMGIIWKRPGLIALELFWRWIAGIPLLALAIWAGSGALRNTHLDLAALGSITLFKPAEAAETLSSQLSALLTPLLSVLLWFAPVALVLWSIASGLGRAMIWRRLDPTLIPRPAVSITFASLRVLALSVCYLLWVCALVRGARFAITGPAAAGAEPNLVLYSALAVAATLAFFLLWSATAWLLDAVPLFAFAEDKGFAASLGTALRAPALRSKLIETNLVMGIVKVSLLVLAMVFSATPVPFASVESPAFLHIWWAFVAILYFVASDLFHLIRRAAYVALFRALATGAADTTPGA